MLPSMGAAATGASPVLPSGTSAAAAVVIVAVVLVEGLLLVEDAALLGALPVEELIVHRSLLPRYLLLGPPELENQGFGLLLPLLRRNRGGGSLFQG